MSTRPYRWFVTPLLAAALVVGVAGPAAAAGPDTEKPSAPTNLAASFAGPVLTLTWTASTDNVGVASYSVSQFVQDTAVLRSTTTNSITITGLNPSWTYTFTVGARDAAGNSSGSASLKVTVPPGDVRPPTVPTGVRAVPAIRSIFVDWARSTDNVYVDHYQVVSITDQGEKVVARSAGIPGPPTGATVGGLTPDTTYTLAVRALDSAGNVSARSSPVTVRTLAEQSCTVSYKVTAQWETGFVGEVTIKNLRPTPIDGWQLGWTFTGGQRITSIWLAQLASGDAAAVVVKQPNWGPGIPALGSTNFGFVGSWTGTNAVPTAFTLGGSPCATA
jgi:chitodextrinase